ncbi:mRNA decay activator protein ZFP36L1a [Engraulis encrasicolus]|uniref:mRNA decay activator protein ZFP36L1a n=1 Tax=Engraulis encrasicolus TaxID=184585 RepID=UPI002FD6409C
MTTAVASPFDFSEVINKSNKMLNFKNNLLSGPHGLSVPCSSANIPSSTLLDRKAVGTPSAAGPYQRRHSVTLPSSSSRFGHSQFLNMGKPTTDMTLLSAGMASNSNNICANILNNNNSSGSSNKENRLRERSFSETGERLLHKAAAAGLTLGPLPMTSPTSPTCGGGSSPCLGPQNGQVNSSRYKTELCRPFEENGACKYGDKCQFAHGAHELRSLSRHPKYKTELCRTFHTIGFCPYGPRCHFIHNAEERRGPSASAPISPLSACNGGKMERPRLHHSLSFAGFPSVSSCSSSSSSSCSSGRSLGSYMRGEGVPTSLTPPPIFPSEDELPEWPNNPFNFPSQGLASYFCPSLNLASADIEAATTTIISNGINTPPANGNGSPPSPDSCSGMVLYRSEANESPKPFRSVSESPQPDSDQEGGYHSSGSSTGSGSLCGSESPGLDKNRRLPIFSRLSISDD